MIKQVFSTILIVVALTTSAAAIEVGGVEVPDTMQAGDTTLTLNGVGIRTKFGFKVYAGGLYLKAKSSDSKKIIETDEPMAIKMVWRRSGPIDKVNGVFREGFAYATKMYPYKDADYEVEKFLGWTVEAKKEDVWHLTYVPGTGLTVTQNDTVRGTIAGDGFKKILFSVWLLEDPSFTGDKDLQSGMLGK